MIGRPETHPLKKVIGFSEEMIEAVETWRAKQKPVPNVSEAIRRLVELGLKARKSWWAPKSQIAAARSSPIENW
jgi:hypothetical protein